MPHPERIGLFGGAFDPVHNGHLAVAALARETLALPRVLFAPAGLPPHKQTTVHAPAVHRLAMLELALDGVVGCEIYRGELERPGPSYTIDTVRALKSGCPTTEIVLIVGSDNLAEIATWRRYRDLLREVTLGVVHRPGYALRRPAALAQATILRIDSPEWGISSTMVREFVRQARSCAGLLPPGVREYIDTYGLYRGRQSPGRRPRRHVHET